MVVPSRKRAQVRVRSGETALTAPQGGLNRMRVILVVFVNLPSLVVDNIS